MTTTTEGEIISLEDREHLLLRPDTLCGSTVVSDHLMHVFVPVPVPASVQAPAPAPADGDSGGGGGGGGGASASAEAAAAMVTLQQQFSVQTRTLLFAPAVRNLFQEILTNALDRQFRDPTMKKIEVWIDCEDAGGRGWIRVKNDGLGVPVVFDEERKAWKPTIAFSHFRSGTNFTDGDGPRFTAGRNGYGCKATNVFSSRFLVDTVDPRTKKWFRQAFGDNMSSIGAPDVRTKDVKKGWTDIKFLLNFRRLGASASADAMTDDVRHMLLTTTINAAACLTKGVTLHLNGTKLGVKHLRHFGAVFSEQPDSPVAYDAVKAAPDSRDDNMVLWEVCAVKAAPSLPDNGIGFVNSLECSEGTHMNLALNRIVDALQAHIKSKFKKSADFTLSPALVKKRIFLTVRLMVDSPEFSSQTKEKLTTSAARFGFAWQPSAAFIKALVESGLVQDVYQDVLDKEMALARKTMGATGAKGSTSVRRNVVADKYDAATALRRGGKSNCSLLVTEGDSAAALAVAGLAVVGRENFGIYALKGKPLNVRNASVDAISKNKEIATLLQILGLTYGKPCTSLEQLNYKKLVIFSDQDPDGAHIGGLILNVIHALFPTVLELDPAYVQRFPTPLVRVTRKRGGDVQCFYAKAHFDEWARAQPSQDLSGYTIKYFKGLGTSTSALAREYFSEYRNHLVDIVWSGASDEIMAQMFGTENAGARRTLLQTSYDPEAYIDYSLPRITYEEFIKKEVLPYSNYSNERNIPSVVDGLKPVQRKALFTMLDKNITADVKVAQVAAVIAAHTMYHHGEVSLVEAVVGMAQDHVGVSNVNLLRPEGQFGTRLDPPSVHSAPRYIFTGLDPVARALFPKDDDAVLTYREEEGSSIEPAVYVPVIPTVLVNGAFGIGTGWSTSVPMYNPATLVDVCRAFVQQGEACLHDICSPATLQPWYSGFTGSMEYVEEKTCYRSRGVMRVSGSQLHITELPVGTWTRPFVEAIEQKFMGGSGSGSGSGSSSSSPPTSRAAKKHAQFEGLVLAIDKMWTDSRVEMVLHCDAVKLDAFVDVATGALSDALWDALGMQSELRIGNMHLHDVDGRLRHYATVTDVVREFAVERMKLYETRRLHLIEQVQKELAIAENRARFIREQLDDRLRLHRLSEAAAIALLMERSYLAAPDYNYLLNMPIRSMTAEKVAKLEDDVLKANERLAELRASTPSSMWLHDLDTLSCELGAFAERKAARYADTATAPAAKKRAAVASSSAAGARKKGKN
jgi:DNA topoisomerase-2